VLFVERGYAATTVDDIVDAAGLSKPALYRHFESKQDLHRSLLLAHRDRLAQAALATTPTTEDFDLGVMLHRMIDAWFAHIERNPLTIQLLFGAATADASLRDLYEEVHAGQRANDVALLEAFAPHIPQHLREPLAEVIRSSLAGLAGWWIQHPDVPRATVVDAMVRMIEGIARPPAHDPR
jgi:AcrR family transcriptional regulator